MTDCFEMTDYKTKYVGPHPLRIKPIYFNFVNHAFEFCKERQSETSERRPEADSL